MKCGRTSWRALWFGALWLSLAPVTSAQVTPDEPGEIATLPDLGDHWVWVPDVVLRRIALFDGDSGDMLAWIDSGAQITPRPPEWNKKRNEIYAVDTVYSRGHHGERKDYVFIYDAHSLAITGEIEIPPRSADTATGIALVGMLDGGRFLVVLNQSPGSSVSVVDLVERKFVGEVQTAGCAGVYPAGPQRFGMLCGNGTALNVILTPTGELDRITRSATFFDVVVDPVSEKGVRDGSRWLYVSFEGDFYTIDYSGDVPVAAEPWSLFSDREVEASWRVGGGQFLTYHGLTGRLFSVVHKGGPGSHKDPGTEVWVWDVASKEKVGTYSMPNVLVPFLQPQIGFETGGFVDWLLRAILPNAGVHSITITQDAQPLLFARNNQMGAVAVLDGTSGEYVRDLHEVGLAGVMLVVP